MGFLEEPGKKMSDKDAFQALVNEVNQNFQAVGHLLAAQQAEIKFQKIFNLALVVGLAVLTFNII